MHLRRVSLTAYNYLLNRMCRTLATYCGRDRFRFRQRHNEVCDSDVSFTPERIADPTPEKEDRIRFRPKGTKPLKGRNLGNRIRESEDLDL
ncbi:hypothetical protein AVEN_259049-1 [Araneus ventricosus]|uniref:Uncharacterized protein n=1 Tax=Araneus ventricosus TaxID=182803 RepID=A0A4Y2SZ34_ARAVE|nr:hypothetical protein AVEN_259049-1 [Araneus ventricosus]